MLSVSKQHVDDLPSTSQNIFGKKKSRATFPCMLCKWSHLTHIFPRMDKASKFLEDIIVSHPQLSATYRKLTLDPPVVDENINLSPSSISMVDHVVNLVMSLAKLVDKVVDLIPSSVNPTLSLESATQVVDPIPSSIDPTLPLESETQMVDLFPHINPILPLENATQVVDMISSLVDPTLSLEGKPDMAHVFLVDTESIVLGGIPPSPLEPPPSNETILFNWGLLTGPPLPSYIPFQITI
jgi:hypothetical protein